ncbi:MAG: 3-oxoacyl-[acyl-carrier-protein] reductase [Dehalococcoidales bacterium]|nr:3-oxoacyl-[acyl-carrier-protein] reductase [Dehalococcoidales bacterium]
MGELQDHVALVTGASRGIGRATALRLAEAGARVGVNYNSSPNAAAEVVETIRSRGGQAITLPGDVSSPEAVQAMVASLVESFGKIDILVNNAGIIRDTLLLRMSEADWDAVLNTNLKSAFTCTKAVVRYMMKQRWGRIVNVSSVSGILGNPGQANYSSAKAGLIAFTKTVAREFASRGITANAVAPGFIATDITSGLSRDTKDSLIKQIPLERFGKAEEVAELIAFLASDRAAYITGQVIPIDGGLAM